MYITFRQGIITYPSIGPLQSFLAKTGVYVSLQTTNGQTDVAFAHGSTDYLLTESVDVANAWGPIPVSTDTWIYWDINMQSGVRTFGQTYSQPAYGASEPLSPVEDQHWFNTLVNKMYVFQSGNWREVIRVFAAKVNNAVFTALGSGFPLKPFSGTQVGVATPTNAGRIILDNVNAPIRRVNGEFFTTESDFFVNGSPVNTIRLEANVQSATAIANLGAFQVVKYTDFGEINLATYNDLQTTMIAMLMEGLLIGETGTVIVQGTVTNPAWSFTTAGAPLWIDGSGILTETDPHVSAPITFPIGKPPIGRVLTPTSIFFDQGLGGKGEQGTPGTAVVDLASATVIGITKLSVAPVLATNPIAVGDNDPRNTNARTPLPHSQAATTIVFTPYGALTAGNLQLVLQQVEDQKVDIAGDTMTGFLTLSAAPTANLHAATKLYVDSRTFLTLPDTPDSYVGQGLLGVRVNALETGLEFAAAGGTPGGNDTDVQFNNAGAFGGTDNFTYVQTTGRFLINTTDGFTPTVSSPTPGSVALLAAVASPASNVNGGGIQLYGGYGDGTATGGSLDFAAGGNSGTVGGGGGAIFLTAGGGSSNLGGPDAAVVGGSAGGIQLQTQAGGDASGDSDTVPVSATSEDGGDIDISAAGGGFAQIVGVLGQGDANGGRGGNVRLAAGNGGTTTSGGGVGQSNSGAGGSITIQAGSRGTAFLGGPGTATYGVPGNIIEQTDGGHWIETAGTFNEDRESEVRMYVLRGITDAGATVELFCNGTQEPQGLRMLMPIDNAPLVTDSITWVFEVKVVGRSTGSPDAAGYVLEGVIDYDGSDAVIVGTVQKTVLAELDTAWDANAYADNTNKALVVAVTGDALNTVRWTAFARIVSVARFSTGE